MSCIESWPLQGDHLIGINETRGDTLIVPLVLICETLQFLWHIGIFKSTINEQDGVLYYVLR